MLISSKLVWISYRWRKGGDLRNLSVAIDSDLVASASKLLAIGLDDNPSQYSHVVVRRDIAYFKMPARESLMKRGHIFNDLRSAGAQIMSSSLIFNVLA